MPHILIVEDSRTQAIQIQHFLKEASYTVSMAEHGAEALEKIEEQAPDLVLTDMQMPEMDGLQLVGQMNLRYPDIPVVLMTAAGSDELAVEALAQGAAGYVPKSKLHALLPDTIAHVFELLAADRTYASLVSCIRKNELVLDLPNDPQMIDLLVDLVQQMAEGMGLCNRSERVRLATALEHALLNAIFRGNLEISREQMEEERENLLTASGGGLVEERKATEPYSTRKVHVEVLITPESGRFVIRDEGPGFDHQPDADEGDLLMVGDDVGRGLLLMRSFMDEVTFNDKGNEVTLVQRSRAE